MSVGWQAPVKIQEYITMFVNMQGYRIRVEREDVTTGDSPPHAPPPAPTKRGEDNKDDENEETDDDRWDSCRGRHRKRDKESASALVGGAGAGRKSVACMPTELQEQEHVHPSVSQHSSQVKLPSSVFS
jgi:hypothetical protein